MGAATVTENPLRKRIASTAFAFRGYDVNNIGKTPELLEHPVYGPILEHHLVEASRLCTKVVKKHVDLVSRVRRRLKSTLATYVQDISLITAVELAQIEMLERVFDVPFTQAQMALGYSLGEITALIATGVYTMEQVLPPLLEFAKDAAKLGKDVTMGVLFSRGPQVDQEAVNRLCTRITQEGKGTIAVFSYLSPNTILLMGQGETVDRFKELMRDVLPHAAHMKKNPNRWPPMHTPITWQLNIPTRAGVLLGTAQGGVTAPHPNILSCVTGDFSYDDYNSRRILKDWIDQPQRLWDAISKTLAAGVETVIHVGPDPNIIPATFSRLSNNVTTQLNGRSLHSFGLRAMSRIVRRRRPWLANLLSSNATLLRAPYVEQIILEDWLLSQDISPGAASRPDAARNSRVTAPGVDVAH